MGDQYSLKSPFIRSTYPQFPEPEREAKMSRLDVSRWRRRSVITSLAFLIGLLWFYALITPHSEMLSDVMEDLSLSVSKNETKDLSYLGVHVKTEKFSYAKRMVRTRRYIGERDDLTVVNETLFPETIGLRTDEKDLSRVDVPTLPPITLRIPYSPIVDVNIISFGIATNVVRLNYSVPQLFHWLPNTGVPLLVIAQPHKDANYTANYLNGLGINTTLIESEKEFGLSYFSLLKEMYDRRSENTKWLALIDDDTFVPSLPALVEHLSQTYDAYHEVIVSANSDNMEQIKTWGLQPYGGGGIFISVPLAKRLTDPKIWERCLDVASEQGDQMLNWCLNKYTNVRPKYDSLLNQMDIRGGENPAAGYFESGRKMLTVHHWRSWFDVDVTMQARVQMACGNEGIWQRFLFPKQNLVLSNGFSIAEYPDGVEKVDFDAVEMTWKGNELDYLHRIGPLRDPLPADKKLSYALVATDVVGESSGNTGKVDGSLKKLAAEPQGIRQTYVWRGNATGEDDRVLELVWLLK